MPKNPARKTNNSGAKMVAFCCTLDSRLGGLPCTPEHQLQWSPVYLPVAMVLEKSNTTNKTVTWDSLTLRIRKPEKHREIRWHIWDPKSEWVHCKSEFPKRVHCQPNHQHFSTRSKNGMWRGYKANDYMNCFRAIPEFWPNSMSGSPA